MQVPLATGESLFGRFEFLNLIAARGADIIQPDVCICGGLLALRKIAAIAEAPIDLDGDYRLEDVQTGSYRVYAKERSSDTSASFDLDGDGSPDLVRVRSNRTTRNIDVTLASTVATVEEEPTADVARTLSVDLDDEVGDQALEELALGPNATFTVAVYGYGVDELDHYHEGGRYQVSWDGFDEAGKPLSSGVYLLRLQALGRVETRKMMLMK